MNKVFALFLIGIIALTSCDNKKTVDESVKENKSNVNIDIEKEAEKLNTFLKQYEVK